MLPAVQKNSLFTVGTFSIYITFKKKTDRVNKKGISYDLSILIILYYF